MRTRLPELLFIVLLVLVGCTYQIIPGEEETQAPFIDSRESSDITVLLTGAAASTPCYPGDALTISWESADSPSSVDLDLFRGDAFAAAIAAAYGKSASFIWVIPEGLIEDETYRIKVTDVSDGKSRELFGFSGYFAVSAKPTSGLSDVTVNLNTISVTLTDNGSLVDGDTVTVSLNGEVIADNHVLAGPPGTELALTLKSGANTLEIYAVNEGDVSPNTAQLSISSVIEGAAVQEWRLYAGETGSLTISAP